MIKALSTIVLLAAAGVATAELSCGTGLKIGQESLGGPFCAGAQCVAGDFGDESSACCTRDAQLCASLPLGATPCTPPKVAAPAGTMCATSTCAASDYSAGSCCVLKKCDVETATLQCATSYVFNAAGTCAAATCAASDYGTGACCTMVPQKCNAATTVQQGLCTDALMVDTTKSCTGIACTDAEFVDGQCCKQKPIETCAAGTARNGALVCVSPAEAKPGQSCATWECQASEYGDASKACCQAQPNQSCAAGTAAGGFSCANTAQAKAGALCAAATCVTGDYGDASTQCCEAIPNQSCAAGTTATLKCADSATPTPGALCAAATCVADDYGDGSKQCCTAKPAASCSTDTTNTCTSPFIKDDAGTCGSWQCGATDFGTGTKAYACCKEAPPAQQKCIDAVGLKCDAWKGAMASTGEECHGATCTTDDFVEISTTRPAAGGHHGPAVEYDDNGTTKWISLGHCCTLKQSCALGAAASTPPELGSANKASTSVVAVLAAASFGAALLA